jgi:flagellar M-ring protein FliF
MATQEILSPGDMIATRPAVLANSPFAGLTQLTGQPAFKRALPSVALLGAMALAYGAYATLTAPAQVPVFQGLADADKAAVADALQASGMAYSIDSASGAVNVGEDDVHKARMLLAAQGLPKAAPAGDTLIASLPMGSSRAVEGETLRGAREADLARTIEAIDAVKTARIHLATPEPSVFVREIAAPAASVMLTLQQGRSLSDAQVRAIRHLVASSVPGMTPDEVSVIDQSGALLSQGETGADNTNFQLQMQMEDRYRQALVALLGPMLGQGNFSVEVHADVDLEESQSTRETYPKDDRALRSEQGNSSSSGSTTAPPANGIPGALSNQPPPASQLQTTPPTPATPTAPVAAGVAPNEQNYTRSFDVGREISVTHKPQGKLTRLSVAVALRDAKGAKPRSAAEIAAITELVKGAVGYDTARGDVVAISSRKFAESVPSETSWMDAPWLMPLIRQVGGVLAALFVLLFIGRPLLKNWRAKKSQSAETAVLEQQLLGATQGAAEARHVTLEMIEAAPSYEARANLVRAFVGQDAERAALVVRQLMQENSNGQ